MFTAPLVLLTLCASAFANIFATSPIASTTVTAGKQATISWKDDGTLPSLANWGLAKVSVYVGNALQQTSLQQITSSIDVSSNSSITFTPDPSMGPNGDQYFIRFESLTLQDPKQPQYPALAFSAKFTMSGMTGQFTPQVQAQINGQSTAPIVGPTAAAAGVTGANAAPSMTAAPATQSTSGLNKAAASVQHNSAASPTIHAVWLGIVAGASLIGVSAI